MRNPDHGVPCTFCIEMDDVSFEPIQTAFAAHSRRGWLEDLAQCHALAALPDTRDGAVGSGTPLEALGCKRTCFSGFRYSARKRPIRRLALSSSAREAQQRQFGIQ